MILAVHDPSTNELSLTNAGFPLPFPVRNKEVRPIDVTSLPMGLFSAREYESVSSVEEWKIHDFSVLLPPDSVGQILRKLADALNHGIGLGLAE